MAISKIETYATPCQFSEDDESFNICIDTIVSKLRETKQVVVKKITEMSMKDFIEIVNDLHKNPTARQGDSFINFILNYESYITDCVKRRLENDEVIFKNPKEHILDTTYKEKIIQFFEKKDIPTTRRTEKFTSLTIREMMYTATGINDNSSISSKLRQDLFNFTETCLEQYRTYLKEAENLKKKRKERIVISYQHQERIRKAAFEKYN